MTVQADHHWPVKRLKYAATLRRARIDDLSSDRPYVGLENIEAGTGRLIRTERPSEPSDVGDKTAEGLSSAFEPGDVLFGKLRPYLAKAWVADFSGRCTTELLVMEPLDTEAKFLQYVCLSRDFVNTVDASTFGSKMPRADWDFIGNMEIPVPDRQQQSNIIQFLNNETQRLDALAQAKESLIRLLLEMREALVTFAVIRGIDPDARLRNSSVSWLGKIPAEWNVRRLAWLFQERDQRGEPDLPLLEVSLNSGVVLREFADDRIESVAADFNTYKIARKGDIVFNKMRMWQGAVGVAPQDGLVSPDYVVAAPTGELSPDYAGILFRTRVFSAECARRSHGIVWDRLRLYWDGFREIEVPLPPPDVQMNIVSHIKAEASKVDTLRSAAESTIALLKERRAVLISDAVNGRVVLGSNV